MGTIQIIRITNHKTHIDIICIGNLVEVQWPKADHQHHPCRVFRGQHISSHQSCRTFANIGNTTHVYEQCWWLDLSRTTSVREDSCLSTCLRTCHTCLVHSVPRIRWSLWTSLTLSRYRALLLLPLLLLLLLLRLPMKSMGIQNQNMKTTEDLNNRRF